MARVSISEAAKRFDVSRPTLLKHLKSGRISGAKEDGKGWQIDAAELARAYQSRMASVGNTLSDKLPSVASPLGTGLEVENERLRRELTVAQALADERGKRLDQLVPLLAVLRTPDNPPPAPQPPRRGFMGWWRRG